MTPSLVLGETTLVLGSPEVRLRPFHGTWYLALDARVPTVRSQVFMVLGALVPLLGLHCCQKSGWELVLAKPFLSGYWVMVSSIRCQYYRKQLFWGSEKSLGLKLIKEYKGARSYGDRIVHPKYPGREGRGIKSLMIFP